MDIDETERYESTAKHDEPRVQFVACTSLCKIPCTSHYIFAISAVPSYLEIIFTKRNLLTLIVANMIIPFKLPCFKYHSITVISWNPYNVYDLHAKSSIFFTRIPYSMTRGKASGPWFNIKMLSYQYRKSHCGDKTVVRSSYLHNGISYTGKTSSLYWVGPLQVAWRFVIYGNSVSSMENKSVEASILSTVPYLN